MPSILHEFLVDLFRRRPVLALELLRACAGIRLAGATAELGSIDLSQVAPTEYRSDSPEAAVARWASQPIELGHPRFVLCPIVLGYAQIPRICDAAAARAAPQLAVLSAMAHPDIETVEAAEASLVELSEDEQKLYWDFILSSLPELVRRAVEARMIKGYEYQSDFARRYYFQGREEGLRNAIIALVCGRLPGLREELESRIRDQPEARLMQLITELDKVHDEDGVRAVLDRRS